MELLALGIDQGIANLGVAVTRIELDEDWNEIGLNILESATITTSTKKEMHYRLNDIYNIIKGFSDKYNASIIGCEKLFFNPVMKSSAKGGGRNKSASIMDTNMVTGLIFLLAGMTETHIKGFTPGTVKKYVAGSGRATKDDVLEAIKEICESQGIMPESDHEADAIAISITTARYYLNELRPELFAIDKVLVAEKSKTEESIQEALDAVSLMVNGSRKVAMRKRIKKIKIKKGK